MKEIRVAEIRAANYEENKVKFLQLMGRPIVFEEPTLIKVPAGAYTEIIKRGALDDADISDTRLMYNHDLNKVPLARTPKTMQMFKSDTGLEMMATLPDTEEARAVYMAVERGDLSGMSFAFVVPPGGDKWDRRNNTREIHKISKLLEVSVVPFPAYPQSSVEARAAALAGDKIKQAKITINKILLKG